MKSWPSGRGGNAAPSFHALDQQRGSSFDPGAWLVAGPGRPLRTMGIPPSLATFDMVDVENLVFGFAMAKLAAMRWAGQRNDGTWSRYVPGCLFKQRVWVWYGDRYAAVLGLAYLYVFDFTVPETPNIAARGCVRGCVRAHNSPTA